MIKKKPYSKSRKNILQWCILKQRIHGRGRGPTAGMHYKYQLLRHFKGGGQEYTNKLRNVKADIGPMHALYIDWTFSFLVCFFFTYKYVL